MLQKSKFSVKTRLERIKSKVILLCRCTVWFRKVLLSVNHLWTFFYHILWIHANF